MSKNGLTLANRNDFVSVESHINYNLLKVDNDIDATWGGTYGGYIQDVSEKVVGNRYIDKINGKAYECVKTGSNVNTTEFFAEVNVKNFLENIEILLETRIQTSSGTTDLCFIPKKAKMVTIYYDFGDSRFYDAKTFPRKMLENGAPGTAVLYGTDGAIVENMVFFIDKTSGRLKCKTSGTDSITANNGVQFVIIHY